MVVSRDSSAPLVVIGGITGNQGGSVFDALAASKKPYRIRGLSRDATKPNAKALAAKGVDMVTVTIAPENADKLVEAYKGADYVFAVTDFWSDLSMEREVKEGKTLVDAAKAAGVKTLIFSSLPSYAKISNGKYTNVVHFDGKAEINDYATSLGGFTYLAVQPAVYMSNFQSGGLMAPQKKDDGSYIYFTTTGFADADINLIDIKGDYGLFVQSAIESGAYKHGDIVPAVSEVIKGKDVIRNLEKLHGVKINLVEVPVADWIKSASAKMGETLALELGEMFAVHNEYGYFGSLKGIQEAQSKLVRKPLSFADFCAAHK